MAVDSFVFLERYPHFSGIAETVIDTEISLNSKLISTEIWTDEEIRDNAILLLTAHNLTIDYYEQLNLGNQLRMTEVGNEIKQKDLSKQSYYSLTPYGLQFQRLQERFIGLAIFVPK